LYSATGDARFIIDLRINAETVEKIHSIKRYVDWPKTINGNRKAVIKIDLYR
jgi:hypothetical protein